MQLRFKQAVAINGQKFPLGVHEVSEDLLTHPYMEKLIKCGYVTATDEKSNKTPQQIQDEEIKASKVLTDRVSLLKKQKEVLAAKNAEADKKNEEQKDIEGEAKEQKKNKPRK